MKKTLQIIAKAKKRKQVELSLPYGRFTELPPEIGELIHLQKLNLSFGQITQLSPEIIRSILNVSGK